MTLLYSLSLESLYCFILMIDMDYLCMDAVCSENDRCVSCVLLKISPKRSLTTVTINPLWLGGWQNHQRPTNNKHNDDSSVCGWHLHTSTKKPISKELEEKDEFNHILSILYTINNSNSNENHSFISFHIFIK